jgi:hypothetical protein
MEILQISQRAGRGREVSAFGRSDCNFFDSSYRKSGSDCRSGSGILNVRYVACDPDNVVYAYTHNRHANYCLAWALSDY